jgi:hypothetical protein
LLLGILIAGCSHSSAPSDQEIETAVRTGVLANGKDQIMSVENFKRINGIPSDDGTYVAEVSYDLVFKKSYKDLKRDYHVDFSKSEAQLGPLASFIGKFSVSNGDWEAGRHFPMTDKVPFVKSEKGWVTPSD